METRRYILGEEIGRETNGTVWKAIDKVTGVFCVIKRMNGSFTTQQDCWNLKEVKCLLKLRPHENILALHDVILEGTTLYLVLEFMDCNMSKLMRRGRAQPFSEHEVRNFCFQILKGMVSMHDEDYCHRDLKPENLLVRGDIIKISDFGLAKNMLNGFSEPLESYAGTGPGPYRAPEILLRSSHYDFAIDLWAMGVIMAELFTGHLLFRGSNMVAQMFNICSVIGSPESRSWVQGLAATVDYNFPKEFRNVDSTKQLSSLLPNASTMAIDLINSFLSWDPRRRPRAIQALHHPFFYQHSSFPYHSAKGYNPVSFPQKATYVPQLLQKPFPGMHLSHINTMVGLGIEQQMSFDGNDRPTASTVDQFGSDSHYSIPQQNSDMRSYKILESLSIGSSSFTGLGQKMFNPERIHTFNSKYDNEEDANSQPPPPLDPFRSSSEYSIWQKSSYMEAYEKPASLFSANLPSCPFPGMGPKRFNRSMS